MTSGALAFRLRLPSPSLGSQDMGATYSALPSYSGHLTPSQVLVMGIDGTPSIPYQTPPLMCSYNSTPFTHSFLVIPTCPVPLLGRDILSKLKAVITFPTASPHSLFLLALNTLPQNSRPSSLPPGYSSRMTGPSSITSSSSLKSKGTR